MSESWLNRDVKIVQLLNPNREVAGTMGLVEDPQIGEVAKVIYEYPAPDTKVSVEKSNDMGTVWFADFAREELELVPEGE
ncbi:MAG TPA: hypothetical protein VFV09_14875 [Actinomycetota bacterium]|jgi:hypothetical protein|nr:hypothetical protein [Actinomycetota bacterium]